MKIYIIYRGPFGEQMINNIALKGFGDNIINLYELKPETIEDEHNNQENIWEKIWEEPEKYIPKDLPIEKCDLLLVLGIHSKLGDLIPPIAERLGVKAVLYPIDDRKMAPEAKKTVQDDLEKRGIYVEFPEPFCTLNQSDNELINEFAKKFGRPKFEIKLDKDKKIIKDVKVIRDSPGGTANSVGKKLINFPYGNRESLIKKIYDEHSNEGEGNCCKAEMDPLCPLMQEAADLLKDAIFEACGFITTKKAILKIISDTKEIKIKKLEEIIVNGPGNWNNSAKACDSTKALNLYIKELTEEGKIIKINDRLKLGKI
ncbi:MAG: DUF166 family protein [Candidatus Bathyarchaeota archaeon]|nr:DUF166 family protein [Candidatus Bathyarchaeota archaeon]MCZ2845406.1 DUF166 family protein [Candidatus Bathyarchaeota archaeon]